MYYTIIGRYKGSIDTWKKKEDGLLFNFSVSYRDIHKFSICI